MKKLSYSLVAFVAFILLASASAAYAEENVEATTHTGVDNTRGEASIEVGEPQPLPYAIPPSSAPKPDAAPRGAENVQQTSQDIRNTSFDERKRDFEENRVVPTEARTEREENREVRQEAREQRQEERAQNREERQEVRTENREIRQEVRAENQQQRRANIQARVDTRIELHVKRFTTILEAAIDRITGLIARTEERIAILNEQGVDTTRAVSFIATAKTELAAAESDLASLNALMESNVATDTEVTRETLRQAFADARDIMESARMHARAGLQAVRDVIQALKVNTSANAEGVGSITAE